MGGIATWAAQTPDAPAFVSTVGTVIFAELDKRQRTLVGYLHRNGTKRGDRIAILSKNRWEIVEVAAAALRAGIIPVPINPLLTPREIDHLLDDSGACWLFSDRLEGLPPQAPRVTTFGSAYERCLTEAPPADLANVTLGRPMHYTSGTTGLPRGVSVPTPSEETAAAVSARFRTLWGLESDEVHLVCSPLAHSAPLRYSIRTLEAGGRVVVPPRFKPEEVLAAIEFFGITSTFMVPTHLERILALGRKVHARYDLSSLRLLCHAGAPIREATKRSVIELFPRGSVWEFYGSTEGQATRISTEEWLRKPGSVGQPHPGAKVYVMSEDFEKMPSGEPGQIWVLDEAAERWAYWGDPGKTEAAWRDGAFTVGDLGYLDTDGYLFLVGRNNDTIITGGVNVYPQEVEAVLGSHPAIAEVVVFGVPDDEWGQSVHARVVPHPDSAIDIEELRMWVRERLASYKTPRLIEVVAELEHTPTGKVKRPHLQ